MGFVYIFGTIVFTVYGQLILKWRITQYGGLPESVGEKIFFLLKLLLDPYIFSGFVSAFIASFFWMAAMTRFDLSSAYPIITGGLVLLTTVLAILLFKESVDFQKIVGIAFVILGVTMLGKLGA